MPQALFDSNQKDELTRALTQILLGGRTPETVAMGQAVRPGFGLGGASLAAAQKAPQEKTLAPGEWEGMTPDQQRIHVLTGLAEAALGAGSMVGAPAELPGIGGAGAKPSQVAASGGRPMPPRPTGTALPGRADLEAALERVLPGGSTPPAAKPTEPALPTPGGQLPQSQALLDALSAFEVAPTGQLRTRQPRKSVAAAAGKSSAEPTIELRNDPYVNNASAESGSGGSAEALSRTAAMAAKGQRFVKIGPGGQMIPANEDGGINLQRGWSFGIMDSNGNFTTLDKK